MNISAQEVARRPGRPKSEEKAEAIREAAACLFMTEGLERTSMDAIAQAAGVSKQTVYSHFRSKDDLFRACVASKVEMYGLDDSRIEVDEAVDAALVRVGTQFLTLLNDPEVIQMFRLMISEATAFPKIVRSFHESGPRATVDSVTRVFARYLPADATMDTARQAAGEFLALVKGEYFMERLLGQREDVSPAEVADHVGHCVTQIRRLYPI